MGLTLSTANIFYKTVKKFKISGDLCMLGKQNILITSGQWRKKFKNNISEHDLEFHPRWKNNFIKTSYFFNYCGFSKQDILDISSYEGANHIVDLNKIYKPKKKYLNKYDLVFDGSTIEHVFNISNALTYIKNLVKVGGYIIHLSPCNNYINDGFYQLSPIFFQEYYEANGFEICEIFFHSPKLNVRKNKSSYTILSKGNIKKYKYRDWVVSCDNKFNNSKIDYPLELIVIAKKIKNQIDNVYPLQNHYFSKNYWREKIK